MTSGKTARRGVDGLIDAIGARLDGSPLVVMLDIDGTLAPIAQRPEDAAVPPRTLEVLRALVALPRVSVVSITGRSAEEARRMVPVDGTWIVGNHGIELLTPDGTLTASAEAAAFQGAIDEAARALGPVQRTIPGAIVENKRWSLSLHYRLVDPDSVPTLTEQARRVARALGLRVTEGKKIVELRPPIRVDKGTAALALSERLAGPDTRASIFLAGDDRTDEDAFLAVRGRYPLAVTVRILADADAQVSTEAEFALPSPDDLRQALEWLAARRGRPMNS
jgi:trehalose-phosphatase